MRTPGPPILLLDVDGVLNCFGGQWTRDHQLAHFDLFRAYSLQIRIPKGMPDLVARLAARFDMRWATMWMERAHATFSGPLGIPAEPAWPWLDFSSLGRDHSSTAKLPLIEAYATRHPGRGIAWIDDGAAPSALGWAARRTATEALTVVVKSEPAVGLTGEQVETLVRQFADLPAPPAAGAVPS